MRALHSLIILFLLSLIISSSNLSQAQTETKQQDEKVPEPVTYGLIEIPSKIEEVSTFFQTLAEIVKPSPSIAEIDSLYKTYLITKEELEKEVDIDKTENYFTRKKDLRN